MYIFYSNKDAIEALISQINKSDIKTGKLIADHMESSKTDAVDAALIIKIQAAKTALGLTNKLKTPFLKKSHRTRVMRNLNRLQGELRTMHRIMREGA